MTELPIRSGPTIKEIIDSAFSAMGTSDTMFGHTENEYADALASLNLMMSEWPFDQLGYVIEDEAGMRVEEQSGIERKHLSAIAYALAERMAPTFGKTLAPEARKAKNHTYSRLCAAVTVIPEARFAGNTPIGNGYRYAGRTFFPKAS